MLKTLLLLPLLGAALLALLPSRRFDLLRHVASVVAAATLLCAVLLLADFDAASAEIQFFETRPWNPRVGSSFALGVDGVSMPMLLLATVLSFVAVFSSRGIRSGAKLYFSLLLVLEASLLIVFTARDWSLFYVCWELTLIPLFFLIDRLGGVNRHRAALNFVLYTLGGSVFLLIALLLLYDVAPGHSFAMADMAAGGRQLPVRTQVLVFFGLLLGFGVKMPIVPLHGWLPLAHVEAPSPISILLSGILLKMGAYGLIRAAATLPAAALALQDWLALLALASLVYGAVLAWRQTDLKAMVAYSSISHMGVVLLGVAALNQAGLSGALTQMVAHGLTAGLLFLLIGLLYERTHRRDLAAYGSLNRIAPRFAVFVVFALLASVGLPGSAGFVAELQVLLAAYGRWGSWLVLLSIGVLISAAYALRAIRCLSTGAERGILAPGAGVMALADLTRSECAAAWLLSIATVGIGCYPSPLLHVMAASLVKLTRQFGV
ncbi:MAG TPA: NADH-quinone oxidoreductase subunit M [Accumulibacter sp.]|uniref:complex I subunit 4 family protein n=1 Tax=Accumulibacter sp. TaxID=2053492 RepID=UPI0025EA1563|nr:NADH-quinone oxidoreductase subunit M [Accumulibacter sp.]MCM8599657.1 NADH-quinone oxidoreductase subunit M [Accumulibacter sp.]MCM8663316.1 NADH-quinone oxidoreductase subunit M [Accumulibacter sp.]HNC50710.1 NADH-quinone oxidoreductase subunit M [Accumulibacter sp.]